VWSAIAGRWSIAKAAHSSLQREEGGAIRGVAG
jgi:hypothetical protein